jgi:hypothetical protein
MDQDKNDGGGGEGGAASPGSSGSSAGFACSQNTWCGGVAANCCTTFSRAKAGGFNTYSGFLGHELGPQDEGVQAVLALVLSKTGYHVSSARRDFGR